MIITKSQKYADHVFQKVSNRVAEAQTEDKKKMIRRYKSLCIRSGGILRTVGLIQFLTFLAAKAVKPSEKHYQYLLEDLQCELSMLDIIVTEMPAENLLAIVRSQELPKYMAATTEVLNLLRWHKQMCEILIEGDVDVNGEDEP